MRNPKVSFLMPIRWLKDPEDRKFLYENIKRSVMDRSRRNKDAINYTPLEAQVFTSAFVVQLKIHAYEPVSFKFTEKDAEKALKDVIPGARCMKVYKFFVQRNESSGLPVVEFNLFY